MEVRHKRYHKTPVVKLKLIGLRQAVTMLMNSVRVSDSIITVSFNLVSYKLADSEESVLNYDMDVLYILNSLPPFELFPPSFHSDTS